MAVLAEKTPRVNIRKAFMQGDRRWEATLLALDDFFFVHRARRECGRVHGSSVRDASSSVTKCNMRMDMLVERDHDGMCEIVFASVSPVEGGRTEFCWPYAECLATARLQQSVPCPPNEGELESPHLGLTLYMQALHQPKMFDPKFVAQLIEDHDNVRLDSPPPPPGEDYRRTYLRTMADRYLEYLRWHLEELRREQGE